MSYLNNPEHRVTKANPELFVDQSIRSVFTLYTNSKQRESLIVAVNTYLVKAEWLPIVNWRNNTYNKIAYKKTIETGPSVTHNTAASKAISFPHVICNLTVRLGSLLKAFGPEETITPGSTTVELIADASTQTVLYQQRWTFRHEVTCLYNYNGVLFAVGTPEWNDPTLRIRKCSATTQIRSGDVLVRAGGFKRELEVIETSSSTVPPAIEFARICSLDDLSKDSQRHAIEWGLVFSICPSIDPQPSLPSYSKSEDEKLLLDPSVNIK